MHCKNLRPAYFGDEKSSYQMMVGPQTSFDLLKLTKIAGAGTYVDVTPASSLKLLGMVEISYLIQSLS